MFTPRSPVQRYCTPACRERSSRRRRYAAARAAEGAQVRTYRRARARRADQARACPVCARAFTPARTTQVYCSPGCRAARASTARTRAARAAATTADALVARLHVPDQDGRCAECSRDWPCETRRLTGTGARQACGDQPT